MSNEKLTPVEVNIDSILDEIGAWGKYQIFFYICISYCMFLTAFPSYAYIFTAENADYRCKVSFCNDTGTIFKPEWLENAIPSKSKCSMYAINNSTWFENEEECRADFFDKNLTLSCTEYVYENENTLIEQMNIPCADWKRTLIGTMDNIGSLLCLPIVGFVSDHYGRRTALILSCVIDGILSAIKSFSVNYAMFLTFETLETTLGSGTFSSAYILGLEILSPSTRVLGSSILNAIYGAGQGALSLIAWLFPYWRNLLLVTAASTFSSIFLYWLILESPRWLLNKRRYQDVIDNLNKAAKANGKCLSDETMAGLIFNAENQSKFEEKSDDEDSIKISPYSEVIRSRVMVFRIIKCSFLWIACTFCSYGLSINSVDLAGNKYLNFFFNGIIEVPASFVSYFTLRYFGRKRILLINFFCAGIFCLSFAVISKENTWIPLTFYLFGKFFIAMAFNGVYLYTSELFPTNIRHSLLAFCSMIGRTGSIIAPQTPLLASYMESLPTILFGSTCMIAALLMITSPETTNTKLPETVEEAENLSVLKTQS